MATTKLNRLLGVTIPTYRRPELLRRCAASVIEAARPFGVPVFVVDDSADDTNREAVAELERKYSYVFHVRNQANLGIDRNIIKSIQSCDCQFAWPLGEDDLMRANAIEIVLRVLEGADEEISFVCVNYAAINEEYSTILKERVLPVRSDTVFTSEEFLRRWAWAIGFIGACVVNRKLWDRVDPAPYLDTYFAHVGVIMEAMRRRKAMVIASPLVLNRSGSAKVFTWSASTFDVLDGWAQLMNKLMPIYGEDACGDGARSFERAHGLSSLRFLIYARGEGLYGVGELRRYVRRKGRGTLYLTGAWIVARMPRVIAQLLLRVARAMRTLRQRVIATAPREGLNVGIL